MALTDVLGHERVRRVLAESLRRGRLPSALLFSGPEGIGKRRLALEIGRALVCPQAQGDACGVCSTCQRVSHGLDSLAAWREAAVAAEEPLAFNLRPHPDLMVVEPSTEEIRVEQVRAIVEEVGERSFEGRGRAIVIDDAHRLTTQAANALLKSLEEPPPDTHFILITAAPEALLATIRSRCHRLRFAALPQGLVEQALIDRWSVPRDDARLRARLSGGSLKAALALESETYRSLREALIVLLEGWVDLDEIGRLEAAQRLAELDEPADALMVLRSLLRDVAALGQGAADEQVLNVDALERLRALGASPLAARAAGLAEHVARIGRGLAGNAHRALSMDLLIDGIDGDRGLRGEDVA